MMLLNLADRASLGLASTQQKNTSDEQAFQYLMNMRLSSIEIYAPCYETPDVTASADEYTQQMLTLVEDCVHMNFC